MRRGGPGPRHTAQSVPSRRRLEQRLRAWLRGSSAKHPRWAWRRAAACARQAGFDVNRKRVQRLWRDEGLKAPYKPKKGLRPASASRSVPSAQPGPTSCGPLIPTSTRPKTPRR